MHFRLMRLDITCENHRNLSNRRHTSGQVFDILVILSVTLLKVSVKELRKTGRQIYVTVNSLCMLLYDTFYLK